MLNDGSFIDTHHALVNAVMRATLQLLVSLSGQILMSRD